jgi:hypothetical protein
MPGEEKEKDPEFEAFVERVMTLKRELPGLAAILAELDRDGYDIQSIPSMKTFPPLALEAMRQFNCGELTEGEMFHHVVGELFP